MRLWLAVIPAPLEKVVNRYIHQPGIYAIQKTLDQPQQESPPGKPLERRQHLLKKFMHVQRLRRGQTVDHAYDKRDRAPQPQCTGNEFDIQHDCSSSVLMALRPVFARLLSACGPL